MSKINNGGPAFPLQGGVEQLETSLPLQGMNLRDYFAAKAMQAYLMFPEQAWHSDAFRAAARSSYEMADAMLCARGEA